VRYRSKRDFLQESFASSRKNKDVVRLKGRFRLLPLVENYLRLPGGIVGESLNDLRNGFRNCGADCLRASHVQASASTAIGGEQVDVGGLKNW
jgi:hypothetical protein